ncbi:hypothetical protein BDV25DRAFT_137881 [Aspergillus avenaceus]|uniref:Uncharacterized protein n=1 Tax=Aspergillus avenaceus TaxID=36643 RepID=A0A5N6U1L8_ASPAV|nr:hypothetical protein BDV25DRAFT_137881 [Aspergillus avenaceus]
MPMRWTPENDQLLLLKILETHKLNVDTKQVADAWPNTDPKNRPTPRAITERLVKMRQLVKASNSSFDGHFTIGKGGASNNSSAASTPRKTRRAAVPKTPTRKQVYVPVKEGGDRVEMDEESEDKKSVMHRVFVKRELDDDDHGLQRSPSKRVRRSSALPEGMVGFGDEDGYEDDSSEVDSLVSEYVPEPEVKVEESSVWAA